MLELLLVLQVGVDVAAGGGCCGRWGAGGRLSMGGQNKEGAVG